MFTIQDSIPVPPTRQGPKLFPRLRPEKVAPEGQPRRWLFSEAEYWVRCQVRQEGESLNPET